MTSTSTTATPLPAGPRPGSRWLSPVLLANLVWVLLLGLGVLVPTALLPGILGEGAALLPSGALGDAMRASLVDGTWPWPQWAVLLAWGLVAAGLASRYFRWGD